MSKTVEEIAQDTGFSITTVRFVINGQSEKYRISARTRKTIEDYVAIHGYSLNHAARSLKLKRSDTIGLVVPDIANAFFARLMAELEALCRKRNLLLLTVASHEDPELEKRAIASLLARGVDGLVIAPCQTPNLPQLAKSRARTSVVMVDRSFSPSTYPTVVSDNFRGGLEMARRMIQIAGEPCHFLCGYGELPSIQDRIRGFSEACGENGIADSEKLVHVEAEGSPLAGRKMMYALIDALGGAPKAFMCSSLVVLEGALQQIKAQIGRIDKDIVIGTFDDHTMLDLLPNRVLSVRQNETALAKRVFERLIEQPAAGKRDIPHDIVPTELVSRNL